MREPSYIQSLFQVFWKPLYVCVGMAHVIVGILILKWIWPDPVSYWYGAIALLSAPIAYIEIEAFARWMQWESGPIFDWRERATRLVTGGFAIAMILVVFLAIKEANQREARQIAEERRQQEREERQRMMNNPKFKAGEEFLRKRNEASGN